MPRSFLMSSVTLFAHQYMANKSANPARGAAWYEKQRPTFSDALALVRKELWAREATFCRSLAETDTDRLFNPATYGCRWLDGLGGG
jgi:hypothetical protein